MRALQNIFDAITDIFRMGLLMWFGAIFLFGFAISALSYGGFLWSTSPQAAEARAEVQERRMTAQAEAAQRKIDIEAERDLRKDGWGNSAPVSDKSDAERRRDRVINEYRETRSRRDAGWAN